MKLEEARTEIKRQITREQGKLKDFQKYNMDKKGIIEISERINHYKVAESCIDKCINSPAIDEGKLRELIVGLFTNKLEGEIHANHLILAMLENKQWLKEGGK